MKKAKVILLVEDLNYGLLLKDFLGLHNYQITFTNNKLEALLKLREIECDLFVTDLTSVDSLKISIKKIHENLPILFLREKASQDGQLRTLDTKLNYSLFTPFYPSVLLEKIKHILMDVAENKANQSEFTIGSFIFNSQQRFLRFKNEAPKKLSPKENKLLRILSLNKNELTPRDLLLTKIWYDDNYYTSRSMDVYIVKLRNYLKLDKDISILTVHGKGLKLCC